MERDRKELLDVFRKDLESSGCFNEDQIDALQHSIGRLMDGMAVMAFRNNIFPPTPSFESWIKSKELWR